MRARPTKRSRNPPAASRRAVLGSASRRGGALATTNIIHTRSFAPAWRYAARSLVPRFRHGLPHERQQSSQCFRSRLRCKSRGSCRSIGRIRVAADRKPRKPHTSVASVALIGRDRLLGRFRRRRNDKLNGKLLGLAGRNSSGTSACARACRARSDITCESPCGNTMMSPAAEELHRRVRPRSPPAAAAAWHDDDISIRAPNQAAPPAC